MSEEKISEDREKAVKGMKDMRDKRTEEKIVADRKKTKEDTRNYRYRKTEEEKEAKEAKEAKKMKQLLENNLAEVKEYKKIKKKHFMRKVRTNRSSEQHTEDKSKASTGMKDFRADGRLRKYADRGKQNISEFKDWRKYFAKNEMNSTLLNKSKPDIVQQINETYRIEKEDRKERERSRKLANLQFKEFRLTAEEKKEYADLRQERHESCMRSQRARDEKAVLALHDDKKKQKLEDYYEREGTLTEEERKEFLKLRQDLYEDFRKMNNEEKKSNPCNFPPNWDDFKKMKVIEEDPKEEIEHETKEKEANSVSIPKNSKKRKILTITFA